MTAAPRIPLDRSAEAALVGSCILDATCIPIVAGMVQPPDFTDLRLGLMYASILPLSEQGGAIDIPRLRNRMQADGTWGHMGDDGTEFCIQILESLPSAANAEHYARIVANAARARRVASACEAGLAKLMDGRTWRKPENLDTIASDVDKAATSNTLDDGALEADLETIVGQMGKLEMEIPTGIERYDRKYGGLHAGEYIVLAALTSRGKSSLAGHIAYTVAESRPVLYVTCEMPRRQLLWRMLSQQTGVPIRDMQAGKGYEFNRQRIDDVRAKLATMPLRIVGGVATPANIRSAAMGIRRRQGDLALVVVDYLQLLHGDGRYKGSREAEVSDISGRLRALALEVPCAVLALAQFNRQGNEGGRPYMHQIRETGRIEQDADTVWVLHWDWPKTPRGAGVAIDADLHVDKARSGEAGAKNALQFVRDCTRFFEVTDNHSTRALGDYLRDWREEM